MVSYLPNHTHVLRLTFHETMCTIPYTQFYLFVLLRVVFSYDGHYSREFGTKKLGVEIYFLLSAKTLCCPEYVYPFPSSQWPGGAREGIAAIPLYRYFHKMVGEGEKLSNNDDEAKNRLRQCGRNAPKRSIKSQGCCTH